MYKPSSFNQIPAAVVSLETCLSTLSSRLRIITLCAFYDFLSPSAIIFSSLASPSSASTRPCWTRRALIFIRHSPKSFCPVNFSTSDLAEPISWIELKIAPRSPHQFVVPRSDYNSQKNEFFVWTRISKMQEKRMNRKTALCSQQPLYSISAEFFKYKTLSLVTKKKLSLDLGYTRRRNRSTISIITNPINLKLINCYML